MNFYHVTDKVYQVGDIVDATTFESTEYHERIINQGIGDIDRVLDLSRPDGFPSRKNCIYAFDNVGMCMHFIGNRYDGNEIYYEVDLINPVECPMKLVKILNEGGYAVDRELIINEYWQPNPLNEWKYFEYLASSMTIVNLVEGNDRMGRMMAGGFYDVDEMLATNLFL